MRKRFLLVANQTAGRGSSYLIDTVVKELQARSCTVQSLTDGDYDKLHDADFVSRFDAVVAAGGDGTVRRLLSTLAGQIVPLGLIPNGTGNVLAHEIGLRQRPTHVADALLAGRQHTVTSANCNSDTFLLMLGLGFDGDVIHRLNSKLKNAVGKAAYSWPVTSSLFTPNHPFVLHLDSKPYEANWAVVANARHYGGGFRVAPRASLTSHGFEVVLFQSRSPFVRLRQLLALASGSIDQAPMTTTISAKEVVLEKYYPGLKAQVDGDPFAATPLKITAGRPVQILVPSRYIR